MTPPLNGLVPALAPGYRPGSKPGGRANTTSPSIGFSGTMLGESGFHPAGPVTVGRQFAGWLVLTVVPSADCFGG